MSIDDATIAQLKAAHPKSELTEVSVGEATFVLKPPTRPQHNRFREGIVKGENVAAGATLLRDCVVWPAWDEFVKLLEAQPGREDEFVGEVRKLAVSTDKVTTKKL